MRKLPEFIFYFCVLILLFWILGQVGNAEVAELEDSRSTGDLDKKRTAEGDILAD